MTPFKRPTEAALFRTATVLFDEARRGQMRLDEKALQDENDSREDNSGEISVSQSKRISTSEPIQPSFLTVFTNGEDRAAALETLQWMLSATEVPPQLDGRSAFMNTDQLRKSAGPECLIERLQRTPARSA